MVRGKRWIGKLAVCLLVIALVLGTMPVQEARAADAAALQEALKGAIDYYYQAGDVSEWRYILGLAAAGDKGALDYRPGTLDLSKTTDVENRIIGLIASGQDPTQAAVSEEEEPVNLIEILASSQKDDGHFGPDDATLNTTIWGLIALDMAKNNGYEAAGFDAGKAATYIVNKQGSDGGFDESGWCEDADSTAHALIALEPYRQIQGIEEAISAGLNYLKSKQLDSGGIDNWGENPASTAAVIEALIALGEDPQGAEWTKSGGTLIDSLLKYQREDGAFIQDTDWGPIDHTPYVLLALADVVNRNSKYQRELEVPLPPCLVSLESPQSLEAGQDADLVVKVKNTTVSEQPVLVIAAVYDGNGKMVQYAYASRVLPAAAADTMGLGFSGLVKGYRVKIMAWDSWESRQPLSNRIILTVE